MNDEKLFGIGNQLLEIYDLVGGPTCVAHVLCLKPIVEIPKNDDLTTTTGK